jgi:hypothetical protein
MTIDSASYSDKMNCVPSLTMSNASETPTPVCKIRTLEDGCVRIQCGEPPLAFVGVVSSMHLVEPKCLQLQQYWVKAQAANGDHS